MTPLVVYSHHIAPAAARVTANKTTMNAHALPDKGGSELQQMTLVAATGQVLWPILGKMRQKKPVFPSFLSSTHYKRDRVLMSRPVRTIGDLMGYGASLGGSQCNTSKTQVQWVRLMSHESETTHKAQLPNKHHHNGGEAANPSGGMDLMNPHRPRSEWPCAYLFQGCHWTVLIGS